MIEDLDKYRLELQNTQYSYSQTLQDSFALAVNQYKFNGVCVDIGSASPHDMFNNTKLLQLYKWQCIGSDLNNYTDSWKGYPYFDFTSLNCTKQSSIDLLFSKSGNKIDYLSLDIDDFTIDALRLIDFNIIKIKCITIEHNKYLGHRGEQRHEQRKILEKAGYIMVVKNFHGYEDWWINPKLVNYEDVEHWGILSESQFNTNMDLDEILPNHQDNIDRDRNNFDKTTYRLLHNLN
jgi:hypothetical protein